MTEDNVRDLFMELSNIRSRLRYALENLDSIERRTYVRHQLEVSIGRVDEMCELAIKGEMK